MQHWFPQRTRWVALAAALIPAAAFLLASSGLPTPSAPADEGYVGRRECARCHKSNGRDHMASNHPKTWMPPSKLDEIARLPQQIDEGPIRYGVDKREGRWHFTVQLPGRPEQSFPVHSLVGGERFGLSLLLLAREVEGRPLARPALIEARYMIEAGTMRLKKSPGLFAGLPSDYSNAIGRVLDRDFARQCLGCHSGPRDPELARAGGPHPEFGDVGVTCEHCHGPGADHVRAAEAKEDDLKILHPGRLSNAELLDLCSQCHSGFSSLAQPRPQDVLISNQVTALAHSECYVQSGAGLSCLDCHDPHQNAAERDPAYESTCLRCHNEGRAGAVVCPVNASHGCIGCHMPENVQQDNFHLTDHWIRVVRR